MRVFMQLRCILCSIFFVDSNRIRAIELLLVDFRTTMAGPAAGACCGDPCFLGEPIIRLAPGEPSCVLPLTDIFILRDICYRGR